MPQKLNKIQTKSRLRLVNQRRGLTLAKVRAVQEREIRKFGNEEIRKWVVIKMVF